FRQLGQYEDEELGGLYYNRFRYYDSNSGTYISKDPIGLAGNNPNLYAYTHDSNTMVDPFGLMPNTWNVFQKKSAGLFNKNKKASDAYKLFKAEDWKALEDFMGNGSWPPNQGFTNIEEITLPVGTKLDRYGHEGGRFLAPLGASFESRALPISSNVSSNLRFYEVIKPLKVDAGPAIPWFGQKGMGTQYFTGDKNIAQLIEEGYLKRIECK
ncbi:glycohydrolase toxin TNT-related protein, partial [uncultured Apibacter sp.]|uniref:glycohydrolase toxin TNT-related protein n=1 Tax=uncultured Apibacter sp. TaxID=1778616 RepID=UPI0025FBE219